MENELKRYTRILWHWVWLIILGTVLGVSMAYITSRLTVPVYSASTTLLVNQAPNGQANSDYASILTSQQLAQTYSAMMANRPVLSQTIANLKIDRSPDALVGQISVNLVKDTQLIDLKVEDEDPQLAASIANEIPVVFAEQNAALQASRYTDSKASLQKEIDDLKQQIDEKQTQITALGTPATAAQQVNLTSLQSDLTQLRQSTAALVQSYGAVRLAEAQSTSNIVVVEPAQASTIPVRPRTFQNTLLGGIVGLLLAVGAVFLIEYLDDRLRSPDQVSEILGLPTIGLIAKWNSAGLADPSLEKLIAIREPRSPIVEAFRSLRSNIQFSAVDQPMQILLLTSAGPVEGKSTVAANLAVVMAHMGKRVILIDADLRRPTVHKIFGLRNDAGLTTLMLQDSQLDAVLRPTPVENLKVLTSGPLPPNPSELLGSKRMSQLIVELRSRADTVIIDSPPVMAVTDALILSGLADGVLMIVDTGSTRIGEARQVKLSLDQANARVLGVVMNKIPANRPGGYYYYYQYQYHYHDDQENGQHGSPIGQKRRTARSLFQPRRKRTSEIVEAQPKTAPAAEASRHN